MTFDEWMRSHEPKHCDSDDSIDLRLLRKCWAAAKKDEKERCAKVCDDIEDDYQRQWKRDYNQQHQGMSDGATECAAAIRAMKD